MPARLSMEVIAKGFTILSLFVVGAGRAEAQAAVQAGESSAKSWQSYDWLAPAEDRQRQAASGETFKATAGQDIGDPFAVVATGALLQEKYGVVYTRQLADTLSLSCQTSSVMMSDDSEDLSKDQKVALQFQPLEEVTLHADLHDSMVDSELPSDSTVTSGAAFSAESHLPLNSVLTLGLETDRTTIGAPSSYSAQTNAYDAQWKMPLGKLPLTAVLKGHFEGTSENGAAATSLPSLEQSLVWKPMQDTTIQAGLRQQQYQEYPGVDHQLNEALFADWSQRVIDNISWHSYAEVLNSKGLLDQAPAAPIASGSNGTAQATTPLSNTSVTSSLPISVDDQTLTFSTGPSFTLQKDISASIEYSNRWDKEPLPGSVGQEQRVSVSLKGTF